MNEFEYIPMIYLLNILLKCCWTQEISVIEPLKLNINFMTVNKNTDLRVNYLFEKNEYTLNATTDLNWFLNNSTTLRNDGYFSPSKKLN